MSKTTPKGLNIVFVYVAAILLLIVFSLYKADTIKRENELAFQKEKEETRKAEFAKLPRIHEEEKEEEKRKEEEKQAEDRKTDREIRTQQMLGDSADRQTAMALAMVQALQQGNSGGVRSPVSVVDILRREKEREESSKEVAKPLKEEYVPSPEVIPSISSLNTVKARIINDFDGLKEGNIYKLDNGQIWEQTDFYIHIRIAIMPSVVIWRDGAVYKMIVDGIDKAVAVQQLK